MGSSRRIEKCPQSGWGCMGGGATDHHLEGKDYQVQLYGNMNTVYDRRGVIKNVEFFFHFGDNPLVW